MKTFNLSSLHAFSGDPCVSLLKQWIPADAEPVVVQHRSRWRRRLIAGAGITMMLYLLFNPAGYAEDSKISVKAQVDKAFLTIGDPVVYTVLVKHHKDIKITSDIQPPSDPTLQLKKQEDIHKKEGEYLYEGKKVTFTAFSLGDYVLDPVTIQYKDADGQIKSLQTDKIYVSVKSVAEGEEKQDIRGVKGVVKIPKKWLLWLGILGAMLGLGAAGFWIAAARRKVNLAESQEISKTLEEETIFELHQLFDSDLLRRGKIKEYYLKLSEILRAYFEKRFQIPAIEATTYEIQRDLRKKEIDSALRDLINEVLEAADLAKFAKWKPEPTEVLKINQKSVKIIEMAKPAPTPTPLSSDSKEVPGGI